MSISLAFASAMPDDEEGEAGGWSPLVAMSRWLFGGRPGRDAAAAAGETSARFRNVCISRETGSGSGAIARLIGARLGWAVHDDELLEAIAQRMKMSVEEVRAYDELAPSIVQDWILPLREEHYAPQEAYLDHLAKLTAAIGGVGEAVIVGRGAGFMLPRSETLRVRLIAPLRVRAARLAERTGISQRTARRAAVDIDRRREHFQRVMHRVRVEDPHNHDIVLDTHSLGYAIAAELVVRAVEAGRPPAVARADEHRPTA